MVFFLITLSFSFSIPPIPSTFLHNHSTFFTTLPATSLSFSLAQRKELKETSTLPKFGFSFLSSLKETKQRKVRKRPELGGRNTNSSNHSMNSLRSNSISYFVAQIAYRNPRLNVDSKNLHSSKDLLVRNVFE
ncbi:hypothetical protein SAMN05216462_1195 [Xylanibacter ruminicola]|uniref:Uncharacterized protein n=1 Tax=Xylanibacter ruminicola TaxID=839 RepID=A0A1H4AFM1_XYLRU|nr:hypothetical protein SAMN05216462_1195 [Xylanibacter ruminicola]